MCLVSEDFVQKSHSDFISTQNGLMILLKLIQLNSCKMLKMCSLIDLNLIYINLTCYSKYALSNWLNPHGELQKKIKIDVSVSLKVLKLLLCCGGLKNTCFMKTSRTSDTRNPWTPCKSLSDATAFETTQILHHQKVFFDWTYCEDRTLLAFTNKTSGIICSTLLQVKLH